jgi:hypothetical protein
MPLSCGKEMGKLPLLFSLKRLKILHNERTGEVNTIVKAHFNSILFHKSGPANKQHSYQLTNLFTTRISLNLQ